jgi:hypothetical protein
MICTNGSHRKAGISPIKTGGITGYNDAKAPDYRESGVRRLRQSTALSVGKCHWSEAQAKLLYPIKLIFRAARKHFEIRSFDP